MIILGGAADDRLDELDGRTPLESAAMPALARLAELGRVGAVATAPEGWRATPETTLTTIFGHDPARTACERGPIEAVGLDLDLGPGAAMRLELATIGQEGTPEAGLVVRLAEPEAVVHKGGRFSAGSDTSFAQGGRLEAALGSDSPGSASRTTEDSSRITPGSASRTTGDSSRTAADTLSDAEAGTLLADLLEHWKRTLGSRAAGLELAAATPGGAILIDRSGRGYGGVVTSPPEDLLDEPADEHLPMGGDGEAADFLRELIESAYPFLRDHEINRVRGEGGLPAANLAWPWAPGTVPVLPTLSERFALRGLMLAASAVARGVARVAGWDCLADAATDDLAALGDQACVALDAVDIVAVHVEAPAIAAMNCDWAAKTEALEEIDAAIIAPVLETLERFGDAEADSAATGWRMMVLPDRAVLAATGQAENRPVPVAMAGAWIRSAVTRKMTEPEAEESDMHIDPGCELFEYFLRGGLARVR